MPASMVTIVYGGNMALREVETHIRFAGGIETKIDPKAIPPVKLAVLENGVFGRSISIKKRNGYEAREGVTGGIRFATRDDELLTFTRNRAWSYQSSADLQHDTGPVYSAVATERPLVRTGTQQTVPDHATLSGVTVAAWEDSRGGVWWTTEDETTGRVFRAPVQADASGERPRCVACGGNLHVYYVVASTRSVMVIVVNPANPGAAVSPATLISDIDSTNPNYDACPTSRTGTPALIAWHEHGSTNIRIGYVVQSGTLGSPVSGTPAVHTHAAGIGATSPIGVAYHFSDGADADTLAIAYVVSAGTNGTVAFFFAGDTATSAPIVLDISAAVYPATAVQRVAIALRDDGSVVGVLAWTAWEEFAIEPSERFTATVSVSRDPDVGPVNTIRSVGLASRAFTVDDDVFVVFVHDTEFFNTYLTIKISDVADDGFITVGRHTPASAAGEPARRHMPSVHVVGNVASVVLPVRDRLFSENNDKFTETGIRRITMDFLSDLSHQHAQLGRGLYLAGACPLHYDGRIWTEQGFHFGPELILTTVAGGGSMTASTTYKYIAWYEWTDAQGEIHLGPTSAGTLVTMGVGNTSVELDLPTLRVTGKTNVRIGVARSLAALTGDTAQYFRVTSLDPLTEGDPNGYVPNSTSVDFVTWTDEMSDADLRLQEPLYTVGGVLSNDPTSLGSGMARGKSRIFTTDPGDGNVVRFSQPIEDGFGAEFPPELFLRCDPFGGDIMGLAVQDDRVIIFKRNAVFAFSGDGPALNGDSATNGFTEPSRMNSDIGCTEPASIVDTPNGLMFKSAKGIQLLAGAALVREQHEGFGTLTYVGSAVEAFNGQSVRRAMTMPDRTQVAFLTDSGSTLLYDYLFSQWSTFTNHEGQDSAVIDGVYHYLRNDGRIFRETIGSYSDAGTRIRLRLETAPLHMQEQLQGFVKFFEMLLLGTWLSPHQLGIRYRTDYSQQWTDEVWVDATGLTDSTGWITGTGASAIGVEPISGSEYGEGEYGEGEYGGTAVGVYQWRLDLYEKGQSIQFRIEDFEAAGFAGASFELTELMLTGGVKRNAIKPFTAGRSI